MPAARSLALQPARHPERYRVADDLREPIAVVVAVAEGEASAAQQAPADR